MPFNCDLITIEYQSDSCGNVMPEPVSVSGIMFPEDRDMDDLCQIAYREFCVEVMPGNDCPDIGGTIVFDGHTWSVEGPYSGGNCCTCLLYTSPSPRDATLSRMPSSA